MKYCFLGPFFEEVEIFVLLEVADVKLLEEEVNSNFRLLVGEDFGEDVLELLALALGGGGTGGAAGGAVAAIPRLFFVRH